MELIRISESKLKVMLSPEDMAHYAISCETIDYENTETRRAFWDILDIAKHQTGFDAARDKVYIQVYPSRTGGCELYVTKLPDTIVAEPTTAAPTVYAVDCLQTLLSVCTVLSAAAFQGESSAWQVGHFWALCLRSAAPTKTDMLAEFAAKQTHSLSYAYIREHGRCICPRDAVNILAKLA